ncbi:RDD family protein [Pinibacter soli]|uniref:RDD family protein n=1 Tax=Pinibacter soli TaxID=3044211 RepID=A0ABT6R946_9BACT|nr:RDD family protein [Pinibacter soli]MDI3319084.1 RDD family protein [Pinibacter soli]
MNKLKIAATLVGLELAYSIYNWVIFFAHVYQNRHSSVSEVSWVHVLVSVFGLVAYVQFLVTRFKYSQLLRIFVFYQCFTGIIWTINWLLLYTRTTLDMFESTPDFFRIAFTTLALLVINFISLLALQNCRVPKYQTYNNGIGNVSTFSPVIKNLRFMHRVIDIVFLGVVFYNNISYAYQRFISDAQLIIMELLLIFIYYFVMEAAFKVTIGKIVSRTIVVDERGQKAGSWDVMKRALSRFIPFDALSFLFRNRGWHDELSGTYVIHDKYEWEAEADAFDTYFT